MKGKLINTHQNSPKNHKGSPTISQNHFSLEIGKRKASSKPQGHGPRTTNHRINHSDRITHPRATEISRFDSSPNNLRYVRSLWHLPFLIIFKNGPPDTPKPRTRFFRILYRSPPQVGWGTPQFETGALHITPLRSWKGASHIISLRSCNNAPLNKASALQGLGNQP